MALLDEVDLGRQIARNLEADGLLANLRFVPNLHWGSSSFWKGVLAPISTWWGALLFTTNHVSVC